MNFLTPESLRVLSQAHEFARELGHRVVGTEHVLAAILREGTSPATQVLTGRGLTLEAATQAIVTITGRASPYSGMLNLTPRLETIIQAAQAHGDLITPELLLAKIIEEGEGVAVQVLRYMGISSHPILTALKRGSLPADHHDEDLEDPGDLLPPDLNASTTVSSPNILHAVIALGDDEHQLVEATSESDAELRVLEDGAIIKGFFRYKAWPDDDSG